MVLYKCLIYLFIIIGAVSSVIFTVTFGIIIIIQDFIVYYLRKIVCYQICTSLSRRITLRYHVSLQRLTSVQAILVRTAAPVETSSTSSSASALTPTQALPAKQVRGRIFTDCLLLKLFPSSEFARRLTCLLWLFLHFFQLNWEH